MREINSNVNALVAESRYMNISMNNRIQIRSAIYKSEIKPPKKLYCEKRLIKVFLNSSVLGNTYVINSTCTI